MEYSADSKAFAIRNYVEVDLKQLRSNIVELRGKLQPACLLLFVIKADAYGHGALRCALASQDLVDWFAVATFEEAQILREGGVSNPLLLFGPVEESCLSYCIEHKITLSLFSKEYAEHVIHYCKKTHKSADVQIKIDTGLNRIGFRYRNAENDLTIDYIESLLKEKHLQVSGIFTHFASADIDEEKSLRFTQEQFDLFLNVNEELVARGHNVGLRHCCSSGGILFHPDKHLDMVRTGMLPLGQLPFLPKGKVQFKPILRWVGNIVDLKEIPPGEFISYGRTFQIDTNSKIATVSVGYGDGYHRCFSNKVRAIIHDSIVHQVGSIGMDMCMFDVTGIDDLRIGDRIVLLGEIGNKTIEIEDLASTMYSVNGEVTASISQRVPRVYAHQ